MPPTRFRLLAVATCLWVLLAGTAQSRAEDGGSEYSPLRFAGYGTLSRGWDDRGDLAAIRDFTQRPADGPATGPSWRMDSRLGMQLAYRFSPGMEGVIQALFRDQVAHDFSSAIELAYLEYQAHTDYKLRLGRIGYDTFLMSDHRNLGFAYPWVRPPRELYSWLPLFHLNGADLTYSTRQEDAHWRIRAQVGQSSYYIPMGNENFHFEIEPALSLTLQRESGPWRMKAGLSRLRSVKEATPLAQLHAGLEALAGAALPGISAEAAHLRQETSFRGTNIDYLTLGAAYDDGTWLGQAEVLKSRTSTVIETASLTGYAALGRRFGHFTPYAILSASRPDKNALKPAGDWGAIGQAGFQNVAYHTVNSTRQDQKTLSLGVRWDMDQRTALKLQLDHARIQPQGYVLWFRELATNPRASRVNLLTMSLDFIF
jgi:hypothetical protein